MPRPRNPARIGRGRPIGALLLFLTALLGAVRAEAAPQPAVVLAAASLQEALTAAGDAYARHGHPRPVLSFAATSALARQVVAGAPADLFFSADEEWMTYLEQRGLISAGSRVPLLTNSLVLVAPAGSRVHLLAAPHFPLLQALGGRRLAMADPDSVPAGKYGREALTKLGVWSAVEPHVARAENVRAALALVARGAAPLGLVFATDARATAAVRVVSPIPPQSHAPIRYPLASLARSSNPEGEAFRRFLLGGEARGIFRRFGFGLR